MSKPRNHLLFVPLLAVLLLLVAACETAMERADQPPLGSAETTPTPALDVPPLDQPPATGPAPANGLLEAETIDVTMREFEFEPATITIRAGELTELILANMGTEVHTFTIDEFDADVEVTDDMAEDEGIAPDADVSLELGQDLSGAVRITAHEPASYEFYCAVPGHADQGMRGTLIVE